MEVVSTGTNPFTYRFSLPENIQDGETSVWPRVLLPADESGAILVGVESFVSTGYSGGGASSSTLTLYRIWRDNVRTYSGYALATPIAGHALIRACFSEEDQRHRRDACHDEYQFNARFSLDRSVASGAPRLSYKALATSFPGSVSRDKDSTDGPPLRPEDIVYAVDSNCTYKSTFEFVPGPGVYKSIKGLPDCSNYTVP